MSTVKHSEIFSGIFILIVIACISAGAVYDTSPGSNFYGTVIDSVISADNDSLKLIDGKKLYKAKCRKCHALYRPKDYRLKTWKENLDEMKYKAELNDDEYERILIYLRENSMK